MRDNKKFTKIDLLLLMCFTACALMVVTVAFTNAVFLIPIGVIIIICIIVVSLTIGSIHKAVTRILHGANYTGASGNVQKGLENMTMPVAIVSKNAIIWYNSAFRAEFLTDADSFYIPYKDLFVDMDKIEGVTGGSFCTTFGDETYTVYVSEVCTNSDETVFYFANDTQLKQRSLEYLESRPSVMIIELDTYDEIIREMKDSDKARILSDVEKILEQFIGATTGMLRRVSATRYIAVMEERHMREIIKNKFSVLDTAREVAVANGIVSLSIGVGRIGDTIQECEYMASQALDMALGRGGDQAAVKTKEGFEFYGGVLRSVEKRNKVRSRIIATALCDLIKQSDNVIVTGHKMSDLDSVGACAGVHRIVKMCGKPVCVMVDVKNTQAGRLLEILTADDMNIVSPEAAEMLIERKTLLIIVDTHMSTLLESQSVYKNAANVVVIDHHRRCVGYIENSVIFYHEPSASSASELVSELLQYVSSADKENKITSAEAQALLAGIMLDTRNFSIHTGVRTFEAAAYLRRMGAQTHTAKKLFNSTLESYTVKSQLVAKAQVYMDCAIVTQDNLSYDLSVVIPQAANDLLTIDNVQASFVAVDMGDQIMVSARSMGDVNVQVIMEKLGGGGHLTMAGAQLKDVSLNEAKDQIMQAIAQYRENETKK